MKCSTKHVLFIPFYIWMNELFIFFGRILYQLTRLFCWCNSTICWKLWKMWIYSESHAKWNFSFLFMPQKTKWIAIEIKSTNWFEIWIPKVLKASEYTSAIAHGFHCRLLLYIQIVVLLLNMESHNLHNCAKAPFTFKCVDSFL